MANGRFLKYYWDIRSVLAENDDILDSASSRFRLSSEDEARYAGRLDFRIAFNAGSLLIATAVLSSNDDVIEHDYYYCFRGPDSNRVFSYDDRDHHPEVETYPHHMHKGPEPQDSDNGPRAWPSDLDAVSFSNVFRKIRETYFD